MKIFNRITIILTFLGILFLHFYAPRFITEIKNPLIQIIRKNHSITPNPSFENSQLEGKYINFNSFDGVKLSSYFTYSNLDTTKGTVILLHGIRSKKESFIELSKKLSLLGYNSVALDLRAHGQSKGTHCTFGVKEKKDISELVDILEEKEHINRNIGVWGQSLGGAIGIQVLGEDKRIKFGVIESTFTDFKTITNDYFEYNLGFSFKPLTNYLVSRAGEIADFNPEDAKPIKYCKKIEQPIVIVHGNKDLRISIKYAKKNFASISCKEKKFIEVVNANHMNLWKVGGKDYFQEIINFIDKNTVDRIGI